MRILFLIPLLLLSLQAVGQSRPLPKEEPSGQPKTSWDVRTEKSDAFYLLPGNYRDEDPVTVYDFSSSLGAIFGLNVYADMGYGQRFVVANPYEIIGADFLFGRNFGPSGYVTFTVWDFTGTGVGAVLGKKRIHRSMFENTSGKKPFKMVFDEPIRVERDFVIGVDLRELGAYHPETNIFEQASSLFGSGGNLGHAYFWEHNDEWKRTLDYGFDLDIAVAPYVRAYEVQVLTYTPQNITQTTALASGSINEVVASQDPSKTDYVSGRGFVYGPENEPKNASFSVTAGSGGGSFQASLLELTPDKEYNIWAYAIVEGGNIYGNKEIFRTLSDWTIIASAGPNGEIEPSGSVLARHGTDKSFAISPEEGYYIESIRVDGSPIDLVFDSNWHVGSGTYTFRNVSKNHTIEVVFALVVHTISAATGSNGGIEPSGNIMVNHGSDQVFTVTPETGYRISFIQVDSREIDLGSDANWDAAKNKYTFRNVRSNNSIYVGFGINTYSLVYRADDNGRIDGISFQTVNHGGTGQPVNADPDHGYEFSSWSDGKTENPRTDQNVTSDLEVTAFFKIKTYHVNVSAGQGGTISPAGTLTVNHGSSLSMALSPKEGYHISAILLDGSPVNLDNDPDWNSHTQQFTLSNISSNHQVHAIFEINTYSLRYLVHSNGRIQGETTQTVEHGSNGKQVTAVPDSGYRFDWWSDEFPDSIRTERNVTADLEVVAYFSLITYQVNLQTDPPNGGSVEISVEGYIHAGTNILPGSLVGLVAIPEQGFRFDQFIENGKTLSRSANHYFVIHNSRDISAQFSVATNTHQAVEGGFLVYPNPTPGVVWVRLPRHENPATLVQVYNLQGQQFYQASTTSLSAGDSFYLDLGNLPRGLYILIVTTNSRTYSERFRIDR